MYFSDLVVSASTCVCLFTTQHHSAIHKVYVSHHFHLHAGKYYTHWIQWMIMSVSALAADDCQLNTKKINKTSYSQTSQQRGNLFAQRFSLKQEFFSLSKTLYFSNFEMHKIHCQMNLVVDAWVRFLFDWIILLDFCATKVRNQVFKYPFSITLYPTPKSKIQAIVIKDIRKNVRVLLQF